MDADLDIVDVLPGLLQKIAEGVRDVTKNHMKLCDKLRGSDCSKHIVPLGGDTVSTRIPGVMCPKSAFGKGLDMFWFLTKDHHKTIVQDILVAFGEVPVLTLKRN